MNVKMNECNDPHGPFKYLGLFLLMFWMLLIINGFPYALFCILGLGQKCDFKKLSTVLIANFLIELTFLSQMNQFS